MINKIKWKIYKIIEIFFELVFFLFPIKNNRIIFKSFEGQYNDNPKYISEYLHKLDNTLEIIWIISNKCHEISSIPKYVKKVKNHSIKSIYYKKTSKVLVDNGVGWDMWLKYNYLHPIYRRKGQFNLSTWHGTPLKKIGYDIDSYKNLNRNYGITIMDVCTSSSEYFSNVMQKAFFGSMMKFINSGTPRNDILFKKDTNKKNELLNKMKLSPEYRYVIYAPTYRDNDNICESGIIQINEFDINKLLETLQIKFGFKYKMIIRAHNLVLDMLDKMNVFDGANVFSGNLCDDMNEYLYVSDALITDYSSILYDNLLTDKPCFVYANDIEKYKEDRGFGSNYLSIFDMPYPISYSFNDLVDSISNYDSASINKKRLEFLEKIGNYEQGNASKFASEVIIDKLSE